jgi:Protein of unknown function (DUF2851).
MTEEFLSFLWKYRLYDADCLKVEGNKIQVLSTGELNRDSGPDFFNARLKMDDTIWAGNIEIHQKASDWNRHGHDKNAAFDNVVLHITGENDAPVYTSKGRHVPTIILNFDPLHLSKYNSLMQTNRWIPCADYLLSVEPVIISSILSKMGIERLEFRTNLITDDLGKSINDWEEVFYRYLARSFGFHVNSHPFEMLARSIPYIMVKKHGHQRLQLEALFFGQAGFLLDDYSKDDYYNSLREEYNFLRAKYDLQTIEPHLWKFMRLRPGNFPTIRIAQFVAMLNTNVSLFAAVLDASTTKSLHEILLADVSAYWQNHYTFGNPSPLKSKSLGRLSADVLIINTIVPFYFIYGKKTGKVEFQDKAMKFLEEIEAEGNAIVRLWKQVGIKPKNAFESQALLHLKSEYCDRKRCTECGIGVKIISKG